MLVPLFLAATLLVQVQVSHTPIVRSEAAKPAVRESLPVVICIPPIPFFQGDALHLTPRRQLMPLTATLKLDGPAEEAREEEDLVAAINTERTSRGLEALAPDPLLSEAARAHCREMCNLNYFAHQSPTPSDATPIDRYLDALHTVGEKRPTAALVGENIFYASVTDSLYNADYAHHSLMASPSHRENILEPRFTKVGVGLYRDAQGRFWVTEMFLRDS
jgi:uncharacterized protein YkwD